MDGQNFNNDQNSNNGQNTGTPQYSNYQDNTSNLYSATNYSNDNSGGKASGIQVASMVLGILSIVFSCCYGVPGLIMGIIGLICGIKGNSEGKNGIGTAGVVCSIIGLILSVIFLIYFMAVGFAFVDLFNNNPDAMNDLLEYYNNY